MKRGFSVVELLVIIVLLGVMLGLGVVGMRSVQANARDAERKSDIESIARGLEVRYKNGSAYQNNAGTNVTNEKGSYPGNNEMWEYAWYRTLPASSIMPGATEAAITSPSGNRLNAVCFFYWSGANTTACDVVEKDSVIQSAFSDGNGGWRDTYIYEFVGRNNTYCNVDCSRYNLYWISETDKTVFKGIPGLKVLKSKKQ